MSDPLRPEDLDGVPDPAGHGEKAALGGSDQADGAQRAESAGSLARPRRRRQWIVVGAAALAIALPAAWLGAEYALDRDEIGAIEAQLAQARSLYASAADRPDDAGEAAACDAILARAAPLLAPPWYRHVAASMVDGDRISALSRDAGELRDRALRRQSNRAWWRELSAAMAAAMADPARTVPDMLLRLDEFEASVAPHPDEGGIPSDARAAVSAQWADGIAALTAQQDEALRGVARAAGAAQMAADRAALDAALAAAPGPETRDLNPPELAQARARLDEIAGRVRTEIALREELEASLARALSASLAIDAETAAAEDARRARDAVAEIEIPEGARFSALRAAKAEAVEAAQRRATLLDARDRDRAWVESIARRLEGAATTQDAVDALALLAEPPPGGSALAIIQRRIDEVAGQARLGIQARRAASRSWREELALASDLAVSARTPADLRRATAALRTVADSPARDPGSTEDAQALASALRARDTTARRIAREMTAPLSEEIDGLADPRSPSPLVRDALSPSSDLAELPEAADAVARLRARLAARVAAYEAFDAAVARAREALSRGDILAAARAIREASPQDASQQWTVSDMAAAAHEQGLEMVESLAASVASADAESAGMISALARSDDLAAIAPDASSMARRLWSEMRPEVDRALWEACRSDAEQALAKGDSAAWEAAIARYLAEPGGAMEDAAVSARVAFRTPEVLVRAREFRWGADACLPLEPVADLSLALDGEAWSGPIATGGPRRVSRLAATWTCESGAPVVELIASGVAPCREPQPFSARLQLDIDERRRETEITVACVPLGTDASASPHDLAVRITPTDRWRQSIELPRWRPGQVPTEPAGATAPRAPRPESGPDAPPPASPSAE